MRKYTEDHMRLENTREGLQPIGLEDIQTYHVSADL